MPQSLVYNYVHIVFSTKNRNPIISPKMEECLFPYMIHVLEDLGCQVLAIGGVPDHIHILVNLTRKKPLMKIVELVKSHSSRWIKEEDDLFRMFYWQKGYSAFSVSPQRKESIIKYIQNQKRHHTDRDFKTEMRAFYDYYGMEYDERYVWD